MVQATVNALQIAKVVVPAMDGSLRPLAAQMLPPMCGCCCHGVWAVRSAAAACAATLAAAQPDDTLPVLLRRDLLLGSESHLASCPAQAFLLPPRWH